MKRFHVHVAVPQLQVRHQGGKMTIDKVFPSSFQIPYALEARIKNSYLPGSRLVYAAKFLLS